MNPLRSTSFRSLVVGLVCVAPARADGPFTDLGYDAAVQQAKASGKLLLVDFTASWCPPCKQMEKVTWPDEAVRAWIAGHAVAIQVDVDKDPALAQRFDIEAIPTVVFLKDGVELDRHTGFVAASVLVSWGNDVLATAADPQRAAAEFERLAASTNPHDLHDYGRKLVKLERLDEATDAFVKAYRAAAPGVDMDFWKLFSMVPDLAELAARHPPAQAALAALVDDAGRRVRAAHPPDYRDWYEWLQLCKCSGRSADVVAWYEHRRDEQGRLFGGGSLVQEHESGPPFDLPRLDPPSTLELDFMRDQTAEVLADEGRLNDALILLEDPVMRARERLAKPAITGADVRLRKVAWLYAVTLACGRHDEAALIAGLVRADDATGEGRVQLVLAALGRHVGERNELEAWLDEAAEKGATGDSAAIARWMLKQAEPAQEVPAN